MVSIWVAFSLLQHVPGRSRASRWHLPTHTCPGLLRRLREERAVGGWLGAGGGWSWDTYLGGGSLSGRRQGRCPSEQECGEEGSGAPPHQDFELDHWADVGAICQVTENQESSSSGSQKIGFGHDQLEITIRCQNGDRQTCVQNAQAYNVKNDGITHTI